MISLYPANPLKDEKDKPVQKKADSTVESDDHQTKPIQRKEGATSEPDRDTKDTIQQKTESTAQNELEKDKPSSNKLVQTKLSVGKVGDRYEQEADQVAAKVMTMPDPAHNRIQRQPEQPESDIQPKPLAITPLVQRQASEEEVQTKATQERSQPDNHFEARLSSSMAGGNPLPEDVRSFMEPRLGVSLKHVKAHTGANAAQMNKAVSAQAFTYRNHIFYAAGKAPAKDELTAHELTHVIQQTGAKELNKEKVRRSPDETESLQPKAIESHSTKAEDNKLTPAEASIQRRDISLVSPRIQRDVLGAVGNLLTGNFEGAKREFLDSVAGFASRMPGYSLLSVVLGKDPIKDTPVERNATNLVKGVLELAPGGDRLFQNLQESGALQKAFDWFGQEIQKLNLTWDVIKSLFRRAIDALSPDDILNPGGLIEELANIFREPIQRIVRFALNVGQKVMEFIFEGAMALAGKGGAEQVMGILKKVGGLFMTIIKDPVGFVGNLVKSVKGGFEQFSANITRHLKAGLMGWLFGALSGSGLQMPPALNSKGMLSIALQVAGATYQNLRKQLVKRMGEKRVSQVEKSFALLRSIATGGLIAAWQQISQSVGDVKEMVISEVRNWVITTIIKQAVIKLVSMFNPAGAIVQAIIAVYNAVMFFIERWQQILDLANAVFNSISSIVAGKIGAAIKFVEQSMAKSLPVIISFMARLLGLGGISNRIRNIIKRIQKPLDRAMNRIVDLVMKFARKLFGKKQKNGKSDDRTDLQKKEDLQKALKEAEKQLKDPNATTRKIKKALPKIKSSFNLKRIELINNDRGGNNNNFYIQAEINPIDNTAVVPLVTKMQEVKVEFEVPLKFKEQYHQFKGQLRQHERGINALKMSEWSARRDRFKKLKLTRTKGRTSESDADQKLFRRIIENRIIKQRIENSVKAGKSCEEARKDAEAFAKKWMKKRVALHGPDHIAGGGRSVGDITPAKDIESESFSELRKRTGLNGMGNSRINYSIGPRWGKNVTKIDNEVNSSKYTLEMKKEFHMDVSIDVKQGNK
ncbi:DUF4157 domain-containing protein [Leptolyngbya sp. FACHB-16]|nr:DUF4157 domain-containing protein [Leptolyngbya sp. FACHB-16]MBD1909760.1 DUF4157 domain-containing protein [Leptolyngbya sp. FACHB-8]MBD2157658.1 DUF4157 domain-containing protein [Leptolyngbya sp. FACHB-16]